MSVLERLDGEPEGLRSIGRYGGVAAAALFALAQAALLIWHQQHSAALLTGLARAEGGGLVWTASAMRQYLAASVLLPIGAVFAAGHLWRRSGARAITWQGILIVAVLVGGLDLTVHAKLGCGGYATPAGAAWVNGGRVVERHAWSEARAIDIGCSRKSKGPETMTYDADFGLDRIARLSPGPGLNDRHDDDVAGWLDKVTPIEPHIPVARIVRATVTQTCADSYFDAVSPDRWPQLARMLAIKHGV